MADASHHHILVPPTVPDTLVPEEKVETATSVRQKKRRAARFLRGPIRLSWVREHIRDPADRLLLVLKAHSDMAQSCELKVSADIQRDAGVSGRKVLYRALVILETAGTLEVFRSRGKRAVVRFPPSTE